MHLPIFSLYSLLETSPSIPFEFTSKWLTMNWVPLAHQPYLLHSSKNPRNQTCWLRFIKFMFFVIILTLRIYFLLMLDTYCIAWHALKFTNAWHQLNFTQLILCSLDIYWIFTFLSSNWFVARLALTFLGTYCVLSQAWQTQFFLLVLLVFVSVSILCNLK